MQVGICLLFLASLWLASWLYNKQGQNRIPKNIETLENQVILGDRIKDEKKKQEPAPKGPIYFRINTPMNQDRAHELAKRIGGCTITVQGPLEKGQLIKVKLL